MKTHLLSLLALFIFFSACNHAAAPGEDEPTNALKVSLNGTAPDRLDDYWYQGKAEISRYELSQNRYKDNHPGEVVMIFVTEDFLTDKQVKNDNYTNSNSIPILKNNIVKTFPTGIYTYNIMTSVFTPVQPDAHPMTLKVSNSSQEWCGQTYMQINYNERKDRYDYLLHSYFENEADKTGNVTATVMEEELFNRIRINPASLPAEDLDILPSAEFTRLTHRPYAPTPATFSLADYQGEEFTGENLQVYTIRYPELNRTLEIVFEAAAPYRIAGWKDTYPSMFDKQPRSTIAKRTHSVMDAYWSHNSLADMDKRSELGLD
ncbi:hypothetical protein [Flavilitoribacter nigricans]|uniref:Septum formation inhibitor Maf n=1 Tax=Flavilitoribacter nigricans (strain ATCC 23147 / DSM 23189 / NBRC 102662 / NCIMB 1420 / SS-2) TaxID=1122177 RepID=A0A2D0NFI7_FLAN2|nr:hypothetical protein [Flavilitoribacter nigricans]PHN07178.1 hypothetical protein CRP01_08105 [Flavilitoribacter nigricans DSM 23189 = NBRC 102662]